MVLRTSNLNVLRICKRTVMTLYNLDFILNQNLNAFI